MEIIQKQTYHSAIPGQEMQKYFVLAIFLITYLSYDSNLRKSSS